MSSSRRKIKVIVVPHTHWDRAWDAPSIEYHERLVRLLDRAIELLERKPACRAFVLDGQVLPVETYLQIRPQNRSRVEALVRAKRLFIGPFFVLPDEFLASAESLIRNLLIGKRLAERYGHAMTVAYSPDSFGHAGQMPQILRGFGIDSFIFSRGVDRDTSPLKNEFIWEAPDGSAVLVVWQRDFYLNASALGYPLRWADRGVADFQAELAVKQARYEITELLPKSASRTILLNNGDDYVEAQEDTVEVVRMLQKEMPEYRFIIGSFEDVVRSVKQELKGKKCQKARGDLIYNFKDLIRSVNSSRMHLKHAQQDTSTAIERYAEPLSSFAWLAGVEGGEHHPSVLEYAWKELLQTQPHDDIGGCSVEAVVKEDLHRLERVRHLAHVIARDSIRGIGRQVDTSKNDGVGLVVYNPVSWRRTDVCRVKIPIPARHAAAWRTFTLRDARGKVIPHIELGRKREEWMEVRRGFNVVNVECMFVAENVPPCGYVTVFAAPPGTGGKSQSVAASSTKVTGKAYENRFYRLQIRGNGLIDLFDKHTKTRYRVINLFEDAADCGDVFSFSGLPGDRPLRFRKTKARVRLVASGAGMAVFEITTNLRLPVQLTEGRDRRSVRMVTMPVRVELACARCSPRVDVKVELENFAADHRFRVLFSTPILAETAATESKFDVVQRPIEMPPPKMKLRSPIYPAVPLRPDPTHNQDAFVDLSDGKKGFAVLNRGLPEFEIVPGVNGHTIAVTLLRSVSWFSREDLPDRAFHVAPPMQIPEAQCFGHHVCEYALYPHRGLWHEGDVLHQAHQFRQPFMLSRTDIPGDHVDIIPNDGSRLLVKPVPREGPLGTELSFVIVEPRDVIVSAIKRGTVRQSELIVRLYNPTHRSARVRVTLFRPGKSCYLMTLAEKRVRKLPLKDGCEVKVACPSKRIVTIGFGM